MDVRVDIEIDRPAQEVFDYLADGEKMPRWMKEFTSVEKVGDGPIGPGTEFRYHDKRGTDSTYELSEFQPPNRLAWHGAAVKMPLGTLTPDGYYDIHEHDGHTERRRLPHALSTIPSGSTADVNSRTTSPVEASASRVPPTSRTGRWHPRARSTQRS